MVYVCLAQGFELVEAMTPVDYLRRAKQAVKTVAVGTADNMVTSSCGVAVAADMMESEVNLDDCELLVLPGGMPGTLHLEASSVIQSALEVCTAKQIPVGAICAAPSILGHKGMLDGKPATCYPGFENELGTARHTGASVEIAGNVITGRGAGTANQFAFALVEVLCGRKAAEQVRESVVY